MEKILQNVRKVRQSPKEKFVTKKIGLVCFMGFSVDIDPYTIL